MSFKKKPRVYEILRTPEVWEKVILCTDDFSSCRSSASSFFADDIRVIPPLVLNKLCKLQEPSLLLLHFLRVYTYTASFRGNILSREKRRNILLNFEFTLCNCSGITAWSWLFRVSHSLAHSCKPRYIPLIRHIRSTGGRNLRFNNWRRPFSCIKRGERKTRGWRGRFNT